jgi:hypothetical protein
MRILVSGATAVVRQLAPHYPDHLGADTVDGGNYSMFSETHLPSALRFVAGLERRPVLF